MIDPNVESVRAKLIERSQRGIAKYDAAVYIEAALARIGSDG